MSEHNREQIIKALEICANYKGCSDCKDCPLHNDEYVQCEQNVLESLALSIIKELIEENKRLEAQIDPFPFCSMSGCEGAYSGCHKTCPDGLVNSIKIKTVQEMQEGIKTTLKEQYGTLPHTTYFHKAVDKTANKILEGIEGITDDS